VGVLRLGRRVFGPKQLLVMAVVSAIRGDIPPAYAVRGLALPG
jgi:hypothetical protein